MDLYKKVYSKYLKSKFIGLKSPLLSFYNHTIAYYQKKLNENDSTSKYTLKINVAKQKKQSIIINAFKSKYDDILTSFSILDQKESEKIIFVFWYQGAESMPQIIKATYKSLLVNKGNYKVVLLDKYNLDEYTKVPDFIMKGLNEGKLSITSFSDYLRIRLLCEYNCLWFDASLLVINKVPDYYIELPFISVKSHGLYKDMIEYSFIPDFPFGQPYFLGGTHKNVFNIVRSILEAYFSDYHFFIDYFMIYYIFQYVYENYNEFNFDVKTMPYNNENVENILYYRNEDKSFFEANKDDIFFKLSYKVDLEKALSNNNSLFNKYFHKFLS